MHTALKNWIDEQRIESLREFLTENPALNLNDVTSTGVSALWWALNPPAGKAISEAVVRVLIETNRIDPTQKWYGRSIHLACEGNVRQMLKDYENNYVNHEDNEEAGHDLAAMAVDGQNTHNRLVVSLYDNYIRALYERYSLVLLDWQDDFDAFVKKEGFDQNSSFVAAIKRIKTLDTTRPLFLNSEVSLSNAQLVMLVWRALNDENEAHFVPVIGLSDDEKERREQIEEEKNRRMQRFLENILDSQHEYGKDNPACFMGTRHHIIRTLDKIHIDCVATHIALTAELIQEKYDEFCARAITDLVEKNTSLYSEYLDSFFSDQQKAIVDNWIKMVKKEFWEEIKFLQTQTSPNEQLAADEFNRLEIIYAHEDTPLSLRNHPMAALADRLIACAFLLKNGAVDSRFAPPLVSDLSSRESAKAWLMANYMQNVKQIEIYLSHEEALGEPLYPLFLQGLDNDEVRQKISLILWKAILQDVLTCQEPSQLYTRVILQTLEDYYQSDFGDLALWVNHLPLTLKRNYLTRLLTPPKVELREFSKDFAMEHGQWLDFPVSELLVFTRKDLRGVDLSTFDLSHVTFNHCDLRLTKILANPTLKPEHLATSATEVDMPFIAAEKSYLAAMEAYFAHPEYSIDIREGEFENTLLMTAAHAGHVPIVAAILTKHNSLDVINAKNNVFGQTALITAVTLKHTEVVKAIIAANNTPDVINTKESIFGETALTTAVMLGHTEVVKAILAANSTPEIINAKNRNGYTALTDAASHGHTEEVNAIIAANNTPEVINAKDNTGATALFCAAANGYDKVVEAILAANRTPEIVNTKDYYGNTALIIAAANGRIEIVKAILAVSKSEVINEKNNDGCTALIIAAANGCTEVVEAIIAANNTPEVINAKDNTGATALFCAAANGYNKVVEAILAANRTPEIVNTKDYYGNTALIIAAANGRTEVVKAILAANNTPEVINIKDNDGNTALMIAAKGYALIEVVEAILAANNTSEVINVKDNNGNTLFIYAAFRRRIDVVKAILAANSTPEVINAKDNNGKTGLLRAVSCGNSGIVASILEAAGVPEVNRKQFVDLFEAFDALEQHAKTLGEPYERNILPLVHRFEQIALNFYKPNANQAELKAQFTNTYQELIPYTEGHRELWKPILLNIAIGATIIGLFAIGINYGVTGEMGFFSKTQRQILLDGIVAKAEPILSPTQLAG